MLSNNLRPPPSPRDIIPGCLVTFYNVLFLRGVYWGKKNLGHNPIHFSFLLMLGKSSAFFLVGSISIAFSHVAVLFLYMNEIVLLLTVFIIWCYLLVKRITHLLI